MKNISFLLVLFLTSCANEKEVNIIKPESVISISEKSDTTQTIVNDTNDTLVELSDGMIINPDKKDDEVMTQQEVTKSIESMKRKKLKR